jgi:hypothetical protein
MGPQLVLVYLTMVLQKWVQNGFWSINHGFQKMRPKDGSDLLTHGPLILT